MAANNITHLVLHVQCLMFCWIVKKSGISRQIFIKVQNIKFHSNSISRNRTDLSSIMDGWTDMMKQIGVFHDCAEAFKGFTSFIQTFPSSHAVFAIMFKPLYIFSVCSNPIYQFFSLFYEVPNTTS